MGKERTRVPFDPERIVGERYGRLVILRHVRNEYQPRSDGKQQLIRMVECRCDCGNTITVPYNSLRDGNKRSCGCLQADGTAAHNKSRGTYDPEGVVGEVYGRLTVIRHDHDETEIQGYRNGKPKVTTRHFVLVRCECGKEFVAPYKQLKAGKLSSCGCLKKDMLTERNTTHGLMTDPIARMLYMNVYTQMVRRCYSEKSPYYKNYGGRGIKICDEWYTPRIYGNPGFVEFHNWAIRNGYRYIPDERGINTLSIDRADDDGPYAPWNCRWTTRKVQANNKTNTKMMPDVDGTMITRGYFASKYGMDTSDIRSMLEEHHWSEAAVLFKATHPELGLRKTTHSGQYTRYVDKDGFTVIIPSLELQREIYRRRHSTQHG